MLDMRPNCECCDRDVSPEDSTVLICSFECTWCADCAATFREGRCPNCGGDLTRRPTRTPAKQLGAPVSTIRVHNPNCLSSR
ncbi:hypothetical protein L1277_002509 [Okibacterium sp. HSC-33S16]|uniref:DUF1272 domain-containing protein n=1 Tax=Okibacterium sp. HSC-33S16 TaxID=2910965 RepID=UPI00209FEA3D|nr:DUF1272 domain-containing protein [Okibacterium sp. HSC-33S16]MCP2032406.1 hypothetical protein [Okibacterium sp. HSC-33S16]